MEIHQKISGPNYQKLKAMVKRWKDQKLRLRNFNARHGRIESGALVKSRKGIIDVEGGKGSNDRAHKPDHNAATPSEPSLSRGRSVSKKRSIQSKSNHGAILRQPFRYYLKGTCTRSPCYCWHPPECRFCGAETGCGAGDKCMFPHHKVDEQPNKKPKKGYCSQKEEKTMTRVLWLLWKFYPRLGCTRFVSQVWKS